MRADQFAYFADPPLALAHRGGAGYPPNQGLENSLAAFRTALQLGYQHLETDVHLTADAVVVAFHDTALDRVTDATGRIRDLPAAVVTAARIGGREPVPTLATLLAAFPHAYLNIDIKARAGVVPVWRNIQAAHAAGRVCIGSFDNLTLWRFRLVARRRVATSAGQLGVAALRFLPGPLARLVHSPAAAYQVPVSVRLLGRTVTVVTPGFVRRAHRLGKQVHVWTIDEAAEMNRLLDLGVDGIVTDRIEVLRQVLQARGQWAEH